MRSRVAPTRETQVEALPVVVLDGPASPPGMRFFSRSGARAVASTASPFPPPQRLRGSGMALVQLTAYIALMEAYIAALAVVREDSAASTGTHRVFMTAAEHVTRDTATAERHGAEAQAMTQLQRTTRKAQRHEQSSARASPRQAADAGLTHVDANIQRMQADLRSRRRRGVQSQQTSPVVAPPLGRDTLSTSAVQQSHRHSRFLSARTRARARARSPARSPVRSPPGG